MRRNIEDKCPTCGKKAHDFENEECLDCVPPRDILKFGIYTIDREYREALYRYCPIYTAEEVVGSYLGRNPHFPSQSVWLEEQTENIDDNE